MVGRRHLAVLTLALAMLCGPSDCPAGCCLDCLFKKRTKPATAAAAATASPPATVAYAPAGASCGAAYCQQTVMGYVPQIAYRTAFQPVPVTTYQTSTSINPANGLPMTCTRPCTSYTYQARRVPYTTYRPVYTTVPVTPASSFAALQGQLPAAQGQAAPTLLPGYTPSNTALAPIGYAPPGSACQGCQAGGQLGQFQTAPPAVPYASPPQTTEATPWEGSAPQTSEPNGETEPYGATPWRAVEQPSVAPPTTQTPADVQPSLRPNIDFPPLRPIPQTQRYPDDPTGHGQEVGYGASSFNDSGRQSSSSRMSPESSDSAGGIRPMLEEPTNNRQTGFDKSHYNSRAVRDLDRERERSPRELKVSPDEPRDKTAGSPKTRFASVPMVSSAGSATAGAPRDHVKTSLHEPLLNNGQWKDSSIPARNRGSRWNDGGWTPTR